MTGSGHIISGSVVLVDIYAVGFCFSKSVSDVFQSDVYHAIHTEMNLIDRYDFFHSFTWMSLGFVLLSLLFYYLGLILPDIDLPNTMVSKLLHFYIPVRHRGITHSIYFVLLFGALGIYTFQPLFYLGLGMFVHDFVDMFSTSGWVMFYPIGRYTVKYNTVMKKGWFFHLYKTGDSSETVFLVIFILTSAMLVAGCYYFFVM